MSHRLQHHINSLIRRFRRSLGDTNLIHGQAGKIGCPRRRRCDKTHHGSRPRHIVLSSGSEDCICDDEVGKTSVYRGDPGWDRISVALGYSLANIEFAGRGIIMPELTSVSLVAVDGGRARKML